MKNYKILIFSLLFSSSIFSCTLFASSLSFLGNINSQLNSTFIDKDTFITKSEFNEIAYLMAFPDVEKIVKNPNNIYGLKTGYHHFKVIGNSEGRINYLVYTQAKQAIEDNFNEIAYLMAFPDIDNTVKNPNNIYGLKSGYEHYMISGKNEGRLKRQVYTNALAYLAQNKIKNN